jgi:hypothetical protein
MTFLYDAALVVDYRDIQRVKHRADKLGRASDGKARVGIKRDHKLDSVQQIGLPDSILSEVFFPRSSLESSIRAPRLRSQDM